MKRNFYATLLGLVAVGFLAGCASDPTASLRGGVTTVEISRTHVEFDQGSSLELEAWSRDAQGNYLAVLPTISTSDASVVTVEVDTLVSGDPLMRTRFTITGVAAGSAEITATADGVSSTATDVISFPTVFPSGTISINSAGFMDNLTLTADPPLQFTDNSEVTINGVNTYIRSRGPGEMLVQDLSLDAVTAGTVTISNLLFLGESAIPELDAAQTVDLRGEPNEPANNGFTEAPVVTPGTNYLAAVSGDDASDYSQFTLAATTTVRFSVSFDADHTDIDVYLYDDQGNVLASSAGTSSPEVIEETLPAGTYFFEVYFYSSDYTRAAYDFLYEQP